MSPVEESLWFNTEVKPCEPALRAYLLRRFPLLSEHDDVMQETYTRVLSAKRSGQLTCVKAYLFTVARNLAVDVFRRRKILNPEPISAVMEGQLTGDGPDAADALERQQQLELLSEAFDTLPDRCRAVVTLRHLDGLSHKEIAARLGISINTVKVHMVKGVRDCTVYFRERGLLQFSLTDNMSQVSEEANR